jgi:hypothetical protein
MFNQHKVRCSSIIAMAIALAQITVAHAAKGSCEGILIPEVEDAAAFVSCVLDLHADERKQSSTLVVTFEGSEEDPAQSLATEAPFDSQPVRVEYGTKPGLTVLRIDQRLPGGFVLRNAFVEDESGRVFNYDLIRRLHYPVPAMPGIVRRLDTLRLAQQLSNSHVTWKGSTREGFATIIASNNRGRAVEVDVIPGTGQFVGYRQELPKGFQGKGRQTLTLGYAGGPLPHLPASIEMEIAGEYLSPSRTHLRRTGIREMSPDTSFIAESKPENLDWRGTRRSVELAAGVYYLRNVTESKDQWSYNVVAVKSENGWWVTEAPVDEQTSAWVRAELERIDPGRSIEGVIASHHHHDHLSGIRGYIDGGAKVVTTPQAAKVLAQRFSYHQTVALASGASSLADGAVVVYALEGEPHSGQALVTWLPRSATLVQSDLLNYREYPDNETSERFRHWIQASGLRPKRIIGAHGEMLEGEALKVWLRVGRSWRGRSGDLDRER